MKAILVLEDGSIYNGFSVGAEKEAQGEVVFNTSMTGYQEILTDPSYKGQMVCMTYPLIGNYGTNENDFESKQVFVEGFIVKEASQIASNWQNQTSFLDFLKAHNITCIEGLDTRALTRKLRDKGSLNGIISTNIDQQETLIQKAKKMPKMLGQNLADKVSTTKAAAWNNKGSCHVALIDCGFKHNIAKEFAKRNAKVTIVPSSISAKEILDMKPDGVMISNGPGDPEPVKTVIQTAKALLGKVPLLGICLGHQIIGIALGGKTYKLKFGHHGGNHPVKDLRTGHIAITSQNHNFCIDIDSLNKDEVEITHINLNDNTVEGLRHKKWPVFSVQFHPEANPGPNDAKYLFDHFMEMIK